MASSIPRRSAIFFDRDGVLNEELGYIRNPDELHIYPEAAKAVRRVNRSGRLAILITNQAGVARGLLNEAMLKRIHAQLEAELRKGGARLDAIYYCPHHPEHGEPPYRQVCECRKPRPGMLRRAVRERHLNLAACWLISDRQMETAMMQTEGGKAALVLTGYGRRELASQADWSRRPDLIATGVLEAVESILKPPHSPRPARRGDNAGALISATTETA